jgi:6-phospho-3-hexuloisomerase
MLTYHRQYRTFVTPLKESVPDMIREFVKTITAEIETALDGVSDAEADVLTRSILQARHVVVHGAGRVGLVCKAFAMRLGHLGIAAHAVSDSTIPPLGPDDVLLVASSSGETSTVIDVARLAKKQRARILVIGAVPGSQLALLADHFIHLKTPTKLGPANGVTSVQPMATLFEQSLQILFDVLVLHLMKETGQTQSDLWARHTNID